MENTKYELAAFGIELTKAQVLQRCHSSIFQGEMIGKKLPDLKFNDSVIQLKGTCQSHIIYFFKRIFNHQF